MDFLAIYGNAHEMQLCESTLTVLKWIDLHTELTLIQAYLIYFEDVCF